jgi:hypothetical protein
MKMLGVVVNSITAGEGGIGTLFAVPQCLLCFHMRHGDTV